MAMRVPVTPPINTEGIYVIKQPFELPLNTVYRCEAIRTFPELERRKIDVFESYYEANGLSTEIYEEDSLIDAAIVVLKSVDGELRYVPNTYIESYPGMTGIKYARNVVMADVGLIPSTIDLNLLKASIESVIVQHVGADSIMVVDTMAYSGQITHEDHVRLETARKLKVVEHVPLDIQLAEKDAELKAAHATIKELLQVIPKTNK